MEEDKTTQTGIRPMTEGDAPAPKPCTKELHRRGGGILSIIQWLNTLSFSACDGRDRLQSLPPLSISRKVTSYTQLREKR